MNLHTLFDPRAVAIVGADDAPSRVGYALMKNITKCDERTVYPITLDKTEVLGYPAFPSVKDIPGAVDLAVIAVRAGIVPSILEECGEKGIKHVVLISAGFKEMGGDGVQLEADITAIAKKHHMTLLGPNCLGVINTHAKWNASFAVEEPIRGTISFVSQSGALGTAFIDWANREGVGVSKFVSLGNEAALDELDCMEYLADDPETTAVLLYLEQVRDGKRFMELARRITEKKTLVVLRAGGSERGRVAAASHTGSLAPSDAIFQAALRQVGAIAVDSIRTFQNIAKIMALGHSAPLRNLVILTNGGGPSVNTADLIERTGSLSLATFDERTKEKLRAVLPPMAAVNNPIDVIGDAGPDRYNACLKVLVKQKTIDAVLALVTPQMMTDPKGIAKVLVRYNAHKPIFPILMGGAAVAKGAQWLYKHGMVRFETPTDIVEALEAFARGEPKERIAVEPAQTASTETLEMLPIEDMRRILGDYDLPLAGVFVREPNELAGALRKLGPGPYVIKAISRELVHKSDLRAVQLGLNDEESLARAWEEIVRYVQAHTKDAAIDGMLIQEMVKGVECIIGMKRDASFGPVIVFGLGGVFVEVLKDASMRVAPVTKVEALAQIRDIKGLPLLMGARGTEAVDLDSLADAIASLSHLALDYPEIQEIDLNPVFATAHGVSFVDARLMVRKGSR